MTDQAKYSFIDADGKRSEVGLDVTAYKAAADKGLSLSQYLAREYPTADANAHGSTIEQFMASAGMFVRPDPATGLRPPTMKEVMDGGAELQAAGIVRNDGSGNNTVSGRLLFPEVIMQLISSALTEDKSDFVNGYRSMVAQTQNIVGPKFDQPIIDTTGPEADRMSPIAQLAEPRKMVSITLSEVSRRIPTNSIGLTISDEALAATTLDLVGIAVTAQAREQRIADIEAHLSGMMNGDTDRGETALASSLVTAFDSSITGAGVLTQKAWIKYLRNNYRKMSITHIMCDIDTALAIEGRTGKPTVYDDDPRSPRIDTLFSVENLGVQAPRVLLMDTAFIGANTIVGLDSNYAIREVVNVSASYQAVEEYVMRRATSFRFDYGSIAHKLYTDAWSKMTLTTS